MRIPVERAAHLGNYLSKERPPCLKRWRLWAGFGDWKWTKVKDVFFDCAFTRIYRALASPQALPPEPLTLIGARATLAFREWKAGVE